MSDANSRVIISNQPGLHPQLEQIVKKHLLHPFRKPYATHNVEAFQRVESKVAGHRNPLIFDSFCGVGESSRRLSQQHPDSLVIGIDKSAERINRHSETPLPDNCLMVRADVDDFWRLALDAGWKLSHHYLFYPNPWPKSAQFQRRVHGSPLFPTLLALGGIVELRSNWQTYVEEFSVALSLAGQQPEIAEYRPETPITPFERKYQNSGQNLWRCRCSLSAL